MLVPNREDDRKAKPVGEATPDIPDERKAAHEHAACIGFRLHLRNRLLEAREYAQVLANAQLLYR